MRSAMLLKRCVVPRTLLTQRFLSTSNKSFSEGKSDETSFERRDKLRSDDKSSSECKGSFGAEKSFAKASTKSQAKKTEDINRASDTGFDTKRESDELNSEKLMGDNRSSQQTKRNPLQTQRNFSTMGMLPKSKQVMSSSVRYLSEDLNPGMDKKNKFEKKDEECNSCDDNKSQDKQKKGEISTRSLSSDSTGKSQEKWRGSANEDNKSQEMNKDKTMSNRSCGTGFSEADKRSEAKDKAQNKEWRTS